MADIAINHIVLSSLKDVKSDDPEKLIKHGIAIFFNFTGVVMNMFPWDFAGSILLKVVDLGVGPNLIKGKEPRVMNC